ncbi:MAG: hypothetical protein WD508_08695 [Chloroflexota bacterium]
MLALVVQHLDRAGIPYMVVGSAASSLHGEPRTTRDVDLVIDPSRKALTDLVSRLIAADFYLDADVAAQALRERGQFNAVERGTGWKADFIIRDRRPHSVAAFGRRQTAEVQGRQVSFASAEDTVVSKLEWARAGESERQLRDIQSILAVSGDRLDLAYIERWVAALDLQDQWSMVAAARRNDSIQPRDQ